MLLESKMHLVIAFSMVAIAACFYRWQPRTINSWYGYRTTRSMQSPEAWQMAQRIANRGLLLASLINLLVHLASWWFIPTPASVLVPLGSFLVGIAATVVVTERALKRRFPG